MGKEACQCRLLENLSRESKSSITYLSELNEYRLDGNWVIYFCPKCGKPMPPSRHPARFVHVPHEEGKRIMGFFKDIKTEADVLDRFGQPDEERSPGLMVSYPEVDELPERGEVFKTLEYRNLSDVANVIFRIGDSGQARGTWFAKHKGEIRKGDGASEPTA